MRIKDPLIYLLHLIFSSAEAVGENRCPDEDLQTECSGFCRVDYNRCRLLCETDYCQSICDREYQNCLDNCPCGENCEEGCINCYHPLCSSTTTVSTWTTTSQDRDPSNDFVLVIPTYLAQSYIFSGDGEIARSASVDVPRDDYAALSDFAVVRGEFYIFGGDTDHHKIAKLESCRFYEMPTRLFYGYDVASAAIDIDGGQRALICFDNDTFSFKNCEIFDTITSVPTHASKFTHYDGKLGHYNGQPTSVGSTLEDGRRKVESFTESGWITLDDHPREMSAHVLIGLDSRAMILTAGYDGITQEQSRDIWLLKEGSWNVIGNLKENSFSSSAIKISDFIYIVAGFDITDYEGPYAIERIEMKNDEVVETVVIGKHEFHGWFPVLFEATEDYCV